MSIFIPGVQYTADHEGAKYEVVVAPTSRMLSEKRGLAKKFSGHQLHEVVWYRLIIMQADAVLRQDKMKGACIAIESGHR